MEEGRPNFFTFLHRERQRYWKPAAVIAAILCLCLFPVWPLVVRKVVFYVSFYLLIAISLFSVARLLLYFAFRLAGFEFWVLPDVFENVQ